MSNVCFDISMSLDGYVAGPDPREDVPLGDGGEQLHDWVIATRTWRGSHGYAGGEAGPDDELVAESVARWGATIMGRGMFGGGPGPWDGWNGWWGDEPPFHHPVFVLTNHERDPLQLGETTFTFVTDGIESALDQARAAAGGKDVHIGGGANVAQQYLAAGLLDELELHVVPVLLGGGRRLFENVPADATTLEIDRVAASPAVTHVRYVRAGARR